MNEKNKEKSLIISSTKNQRIVDTIKLRERKEREAQGRFGVEGERETLRALKSHYHLLEIFYCQNRLSDEMEKTVSNIIKEKKTQYFEVSENVFSKLVLREDSGGVWSVFESKNNDINKVDIEKFNFFLILENVENPGNLGAILRSADAVGVHAVVLTGEKICDIYNPNTIRASIGTVFSTPIITASAEEIISLRREKKIQIIGAALSKNSVSYTSINYRKPVAIMMGSESQGLSSFWLKNCDALVKIPMKGMADSLNVSSAAAVLLYEVLKQREDI